jgi:hypothetical protein
MATKLKQEAQHPLTLRSHRLMEAFAKSDDERDFYLERQEGFIIYVDLDKPQAEVEALEEELFKNKERYCIIPKLTFYETKKIMEGFINEKVYDIDTKEKLLDIIQSKDARSNFLEFLYDHHTELDKWQQFYQERSRIRIIEWLRNNHFHFVFEEDLELTSSLLDKLKRALFQVRVGKDIAAARKTLIAKAKTYYSNEALNPRPKRGRPPKQAVKQEIEPQVTSDIYMTVPQSVHPFLFTPDISSASAITFSSKFETQEQLSRRMNTFVDSDVAPDGIHQKLAALKGLSKGWVDPADSKSKSKFLDDDEEEEDDDEDDDFDDDEDDDDDEDFEDLGKSRKRPTVSHAAGKRVAATKPKSQAKVPSKVNSKAKPKAVIKGKPAAKAKPLSKAKPLARAKPLAKAKTPDKSLAKPQKPKAVIKAAPTAKSKANLSSAQNAKPKVKAKIGTNDINGKKKNKRIIPIRK